MAIQNMTTADSVLKELYNGQRLQNLTYANNALLALLPKMEDFVGRNYRLPVAYGNPQNRSATFATAVAGTTSTLYDDFILTAVKNYSLGFVDGQVMKAGVMDKGAMVDVLQQEGDRAAAELGNDIAFSLTRDSAGARGQVNAEPAEAASTVITMAEAQDIVSIEVGQSIVFYSAKSGGSQRTFDGSTTSGLVTAVDRAAGTLTIGVAYTSSGTIAANDYIFVSGDRGLKMSGLEAWIPDSAPSSTSFFGVDRSVDTSRLGGNRFTGTGRPIEEALIDGSYVVGREGGKPDYCFLNYAKYGKLIKELGSKVSYVDVNANAQIGFRGIEVHGGAGSMVVLPDRSIRDNAAYLLQMDTWVLASTGPLVQLLDMDGKYLRQATADAYELRFGSYAQLGCRAPGKNCVVTID